MSIDIQSASINECLNTRMPTILRRLLVDSFDRLKYTGTLWLSNLVKTQMNGNTLWVALGYNEGRSRQACIVCVKPIDNNCLH